MIDTLIATVVLVIAYPTYRETFNAKSGPARESREEKENLPNSRLLKITHRKFTIF